MPKMRTATTAVQATTLRSNEPNFAPPVNFEKKEGSSGMSAGGEGRVEDEGGMQLRTVFVTPNVRGNAARGGGRACPCGR